MSATQAPNPNASSPGVIVVGLDRPQLIETLLAEYPQQPNGYSTPIFLVEPDRARGEALAQSLSNPARFRCFFGSTAEQDLVQWLRERLHQITIPRTLEASGQHHATRARAIATQIERLVTEQTAKAKAYTEEIEHRIAELGPDGRSMRFDRIRSGDPARIMIVTTRYSTYIQHASADLAATLKQQGHETRLLCEPDAHSTLTPLLCLHALHEFEPDCCVVVNYPRVLHEEYFPPGIPHVCWVQDAMAHLFQELPRAPELTDFIAGHIYRNAIAVQQFPAANQLQFPVPVSTRKFHPEPVSDELRQRYACDIAYISHQSQPAGAYHDTFVAQFPQHMHAHFDAMRLRLDDIVRRWETEPINAQLKSLRRAMAGGFGKPDDTQLQQMLWTQYLHPMLERLLRHQTLEWAADIAGRHKLKLRIYGRGWENHPSLAPYARGELPHGEALRAAYQCSRVQLHASSMGCGHQRISECVLSGGLMLARRNWDESYRENLFKMQAFLESEPEPDACLLVDRRPCFTLRNHEQLRTIIEERARIPRPIVGWDHEQFEDGLYAQIDTLKQPQFRVGELPVLNQRPLQLLDDPDALTFSTRDELEAGILRVVRDDAWRDARSAATRIRATDIVSMDRFAKSMIELLCDRLTPRKPAALAGVAT
ncbi:MAG: hypothetical protein ACF8MF_07455 [Phycisphaerales bacterium JB052]